MCACVVYCCIISAVCSTVHATCLHLQYAVRKFYDFPLDSVHRFDSNPHIRFFPFRKWKKEEKRLSKCKRKMKIWTNKKQQQNTHTHTHCVKTICYVNEVSNEKCWKMRMFSVKMHTTQHDKQKYIPISAEKRKERYKINKRKARKSRAF